MPGGVSSARLISMSRSGYIPIFRKIVRAHSFLKFFENFSLVRLPPVVYLNFLLMHSVRRIANNAIGRQDKNKPHKPIILRPKIRF